jgi:hypothetical protein
MRLFFRAPNGQMNRADGEDPPLVPLSVDPTNTKRSGQFMGIGLCTNRQGINYLYVIVANRSFSAPDSSQVMAGGQTDSNYWVLTCS